MPSYKPSLRILRKAKTFQFVKIELDEILKSYKSMNNPFKSLSRNRKWNGATSKRKCF